MIGSTMGQNSEKQGKIYQGQCMAGRQKASPALLLT